MSRWCISKAHWLTRETFTASERTGLLWIRSLVKHAEREQRYQLHLYRATIQFITKILHNQHLFYPIFIHVQRTEIRWRRAIYFLKHNLICMKMAKRSTALDTQSLWSNQLDGRSNSVFRMWQNNQLVMGLVRIMSPDKKKHQLQLQCFRLNEKYCTNYLPSNSIVMEIARYLSSLFKLHFSYQLKKEKLIFSLLNTKHIVDERRKKYTKNGMTQ